MKVLLINGSPRKDGNTARALNEVASALNAEGVETEIVNLGTKPVQGCISCYRCRELKRCALNDDLYNAVRSKLETADGLIVGTPVYYASPNGSLIALLDRLFFSSKKHLLYKPAAAVAVCRRGGATAALDCLNKYFTISNMPVVPSQYWNIIHGFVPGEVAQDAEGLQTMRTLGRNMAWMLRMIEKAGAELPKREAPLSTNFIR